MLVFSSFSLLINAVLCTLVYYLDNVTLADKIKSVFALATLIAVPLTAIMFVLVTKHLKKVPHYDLLFVGALLIVVVGWTIIANKMINDINTLMIGYFYLIGVFITDLGFLM